MTAPAIVALSPTLRPVEAGGATGELGVVEEISDVVEVLNVGFVVEVVSVVGLKGVKIDEEIDEDDWVTDREFTPPVIVACTFEVVVKAGNIVMPT